MKILSLLSIVAIVSFLISCSGDDIIVTDFEQGYASWTNEGVSFGNSPFLISEGQNTVQGGYSKTGSAVASASSDPGVTGTLTSPEIRVEKRYLVFLFSASNSPDSVGIRLLRDGEEIMTKTGDGERSLSWNHFDLSEYKNSKIRIQLVDNARGARNRLQADYFYFSDKLPVTEKSKNLTISNRYINLPVRTGDPRKRVIVEIDGEYYDEFTIELADSAPEYYAFIDAGKFIGKKAEIYTTSIERESKAFKFISVDDEIKNAGDLYNEPLRQQVHFSSKRGWNNDPNGLVYYDGEYHMYYQHNPYGWSSGQKHWGHAVSTDLVHWEELAEGINPRSYGDWVFSGSAIMDPDNTSGFKNGDEDVMIIAYTSTGRGECIAYSNDKGRTIIEYENNPVVEHRGRDPKLIWYEKGKHWVMALYHEEDNKRWLSFYTSDNLKNWQFQSKNENFYECPEIFELPVDGDILNKKWIIYEANGMYQIGSFDGKTFVPETGKIPNNYGNCFYASQTFNNVPEEDGRRIQIAWGRNVNTPGMPFNQSMLFPVSLTLRSTSEGIRMFSEPVKEIDLLHKKELKLKDVTISHDNVPEISVQGNLFHILADFRVDETSVFGFKIHGTEIIYDAEKGELRSGNIVASLKPENGNINIEIIADRNTIEIFCNNGEVYVPVARDLQKEYGFEFLCNGGTAVAETLEIYELNSIWNDRQNL